MFGKMIYFDKGTVDEYTSVIKGEKQLEISEYEISKGKGLALDLKAISADASADKKYIAKVRNSQLFDCVEFEKLLDGRDDYFDFSENNGYDLSTVPCGCIVKVNGYAEIPESFDLMKLLDQFKSFLLGTIDSSDPSSEALKAVMGNASATKIPIVIDADDYLLCSKINQSMLSVEYDEFEDLDGEEVTILARISSGVINSGTAFYDPLKDFMSLNRAMRKSIKDRGKELAALNVEKNYRRADILAIYR